MKIESLTSTPIYFQYQLQGREVTVRASIRDLSYQDTPRSEWVSAETLAPRQLSAMRQRAVEMSRANRRCVSDDGTKIYKWDERGKFAKFLGYADEVI